MPNDMTVDELVAEAHYMQRFFQDQLGFDEADFYSIRITNKAKICFVFSLYDDFQGPLPQQYRVEHENYRDFSGETIADIWATIRRIPSRERRELLVMAKQLAGAVGQADKLVSLAGKEFAAKLKQDHADLYTLLEPPAVPDLDDEIPF